jgi:hypothetical protein
MGILVLAQLAIAVGSWLTLARDVGPFPVPTRRWPEVLIWLGLLALLVLARGSFGFGGSPPDYAFLIPVCSALLLVAERRWLVQREEDLIEELQEAPAEGPLSSPTPSFADPDPLEPRLRPSQDALEGRSDE